MATRTPMLPPSKHQSKFVQVKQLATAMGRRIRLETRASDRRITYVVEDREQSYHFTQLHDVHAHLTAAQEGENGTR